MCVGGRLRDGEKESVVSWDFSVVKRIFVL